MFFSSQLPLAHLIELCRVLRHNLGAGLSLVQVFRQQGARGPAGLRPFAQRITRGLEKGDSLADALEGEKELLPPLFLAMVKVGEESGNLAEIFAELEKYYLLQQKLRRRLISQSIVPALQFVLALLLIALLIFVLGLVGASRDALPLRLFGLSGAGGAVIFLAVSFGSIGLLFLAYRLLKRWARQKAAVDAFLLRVPAVGACLQALVLARFAMALYLTLDSGMPITRALRLALDATGNAAFTARAPTIAGALKNGEPLLEALTRSGLFGDEFLHLIAVGEEGGRVPEIMRQQAEHYQEEAGRRLTTLTRLATMLVWLIYAIFMVVAIFRIASIYMGVLPA